MKYDDIRPKLNTGDMVLFSGEGHISNIIKWYTKSKWSHVGMVIKSIEWDMLLLWESTTLSKIKDIQSGKAKQGVQLVPLSGRIKAYEGEVGVRLLNIERTSEMLCSLKDLRRELKGRPYEENKLELFKSAYDFVGGHNEEDLSSVFCSESFAEGWQRMEIFEEPPKGKPSNEYTPADLGYTGLKLVKGELSSVIPVSWEN